MIKIKPNKEKINEQKVNEFEKKLGYNLPHNYFNFLIKNNGGTPELNLCNIKDYGQITVSHFFGLDIKDKINELKNVLSIFHNRFPNGFLPIASVEGGNLVCISLFSNKSEIYFWNHEEESEEEEKPTLKNMYKIVDDFNLFLKMLERFDASKVKVKKEDGVSSWIDPDFLKEIQNK